MTSKEYQHYAAQQRGAQNRAQGLLFEKYLEDSCEEYTKAGIAKIEKTPEPFRVLEATPSSRYGKIFRGVFAKKAQPDFKGALKRPGTMAAATVVMEAKSTTTDRLTQDVVTQEQTRSMREYYDMGAICYVIIAFSFPGHIFVVPWEVWDNMKTYFGHKYVTPEELDRCLYVKRVEFRNNVVNFVDAILCLEAAKSRRRAEKIVRESGFVSTTIDGAKTSVAGIRWGDPIQGEAAIKKSDILLIARELEELLAKLQEEYKDGDNIDYVRGAIAGIAKKLRREGSE